MALILPPLRLTVGGTECLFYVNACIHDIQFDVPEATPLEKIQLVINEGPLAAEVIPQETLKRLGRARIIAAESYENTKFYLNVLEELTKSEKLPNIESAIEVLSGEHKKAYDSLMAGYRRVGITAKGALLANIGVGSLLGASVLARQKPSRRTFLQTISFGGLAANTAAFSASWAKLLEYKWYRDFGRQKVASTKDLTLFYQNIRSVVVPREHIEGRSAVIAESVIDAVKNYNPKSTEPLNVLVNVGAAHAAVRNYLENGPARAKTIRWYGKVLLEHAKKAIRKEKYEKAVSKIPEKPRRYRRREFLKSLLRRK